MIKRSVVLRWMTFFQHRELIPSYSDQILASLATSMGHIHTSSDPLTFISRDDTGWHDIKESIRLDSKWHSNPYAILLHELFWISDLYSCLSENGLEDDAIPIITQKSLALLKSARGFFDARRKVLALNDDLTIKLFRSALTRLSDKAVKISGSSIDEQKDFFVSLRSTLTDLDANKIATPSSALQSKDATVSVSPHGYESPQSAVALVSIIVPTYNRPSLLERALESILTQTYQNIEIVVVNDAGQPVENVIAKCNRNNNISYVSHSTNKGLPAARNTGLRISKGDYIAYLDDDDTYLNNHIEKMVSALRESGARFAYSYADYLLEDKRNGKVEIVGHQQPYSKIAYSRSELLIRNFIPVNTWVFERSLLDDAGFFDESFKALEDWEWLLRASVYTDFITVPEATVEVHTRLYDRGHMLAEQRPHLLHWYQKACEKHPVPPKLERARQQFIELTFGDKEKTAQVAVSPNNNAITVAPYALWAQRRQDSDRSRVTRDDEGSTPAAFHFLVTCAREEKSLLADAVLSIRAQTWGHWTLTILADFAAPDSLLKEMKPINWVVVEDGSPRIQALHHALQTQTADWVVLSSPAARFASGFLSAARRCISLYSGWRLIYLDSDRIDGSGSQNNPLFRPDFNLDWLRSTPYLGGTLLVQREALLKTGGVADLTPADIYDLSLKTLDCYGENSLGHIDDVFCHVHGDLKFPVSEACKKALSDHLLRNHLSAAINDGYQPGTFRIEYKHPRQPLVSIIIPTKDQLELLKACVDSILNLTDYPHYEIVIVDNNSEKAETLEYLDELVDMEGDTVRIIQYTEPFNYSAENNAAAKIARGDYLLLLNNDTQVLEEDWLDTMMAYGQRPDIGIVGVRLIYPDTGKLQHAGVIMGLGGIAEHPYLGLVDSAEPGYMNRLHVDQNVSAVTGACLLIRKSIYEEVGGLDEGKFKVSYNDVDLCLKVGQLGYKVLWTPHVTLLHHGSVSQKEAARHMDKDADKARFASEKQAMLEKWLPVIARDPFYNRHLSLTQRDFRVEHQCVVNWDPRLPSSRARVLGWTLPGASCEYRMKLPLQALRTTGVIEDSYVWPSNKGSLRKILPAEIARSKPDVLTVPVCSELLQHIGTLQQIQQLCKTKLVLHMDHLLTEIAHDSKTGAQNDVAESLTKLLTMADRVVATTAPIAELCRDSTERIHLIPDYLPKSLWEGRSSRRRQGSRPRVGWFCAKQHGSDLAMLAEVTQALAQEAEWVFLGDCPDPLRPLIHEIHPVVPIEDYPLQLASLNLDLAVIPLENTPFNEAKSNLRLLEFGWMGWPVICSDGLPYRDAPVTRLENRPQAWIESIREHLHDLDALEREGDVLRQWVLDHWMLEDHLEKWAEVYRVSA